MSIERAGKVSFIPFLFVLNPFSKEKGFIEKGGSFFGLFTTLLPKVIGFLLSKPNFIRLFSQTRAFLGDIICVPNNIRLL
ncbi:MAG: hypothetical protein U9O90_01495 [Euryarchaeota archaeon]|nr:hypothetical protein [Euryarchaeota archaeon]